MLQVLQKGALLTASKPQVAHPTGQFKQENVPSAAFATVWPVPQVIEEGTTELSDATHFVFVVSALNPVAQTLHEGALLS